MSNYKDSFLLSFKFGDLKKYQQTIRENFSKNIVWRLSLNGSKRNK